MSILARSGSVELGLSLCGKALLGVARRSSHGPLGWSRRGRAWPSWQGLARITTVRPGLPVSAGVALDGQADQPKAGPVEALSGRPAEAIRFLARCELARPGRHGPSRRRLSRLVMAGTAWPRWSSQYSVGRISTRLRAVRVGKSWQAGHRLTCSVGHSTAARSKAGSASLGDLRQGCERSGPSPRSRRGNASRCRLRLGSAWQGRLGSASAAFGVLSLDQVSQGRLGSASTGEAARYAAVSGMARQSWLGPASSGTARSAKQGIARQGGAGRLRHGVVSHWLDGTDGRLGPDSRRELGRASAWQSWSGCRGMSARGVGVASPARPVPPGLVDAGHLCARDFDAGQARRRWRIAATPGSAGSVGHTLARQCFVWPVMAGSARIGLAMRGWRGSAGTARERSASYAGHRSGRLG